MSCQGDLRVGLEIITASLSEKLGLWKDMDIYQARSVLKEYTFNTLVALTSVGRREKVVEKNKQFYLHES